MSQDTGVPNEVLTEAVEDGRRALQESAVFKRPWPEPPSPWELAKTTVIPAAKGLVAHVREDDRSKVLAALAHDAHFLERLRTTVLENTDLPVPSQRDELSGLIQRQLSSTDD